MKNYICGIFIILLCMLNSGCNGNGVANKNTIQFITWGSSTEMSIMKPIVEEYNKTHETKVSVVHVPQNYFQKLHLLFASKLAPDVIFINNLYLPMYQHADLLEDLTPYVDVNDYFPKALSTLSIDNKIYAVPRDVSSMVIFYNKDSFKQSKIKMPDSWDIEQFYSVSEKLKGKNPYGFCMEFEPGYWENFVSIQNKPLFVNGKLTIKEGKSINSFQRLSDFINKDKLSPNKEQLSLTPCAQLFIQETAPMFISGRWSIPKLDKQVSFEYGIMPFPKGKSDYYIPLNASGWAVSKDSKNKKAAIDFVLYLSNDDNIKKIAESGLITPAKKKVALSDSFLNGDVFIEVIGKSTPNMVPSNYNVIIDKIKTSSKSVLEGYNNAQNAFKDLE